MDTVLTSIVSAFGGVLAVLFLVGVGVFKPMLDNMIKIRKQSLDILFSVPKELCTNIFARMQASTLHQDVAGDAHGDDDDDEEDEEVINTQGNNSASIKVMYTKLTMAYVFGLIMIAILFGVFIAVNYTLTSSLKEWGRYVLTETLQILQFFLTKKKPNCPFDA